MDGKVDAIYEDQPIDTSKVTLLGKYVEFPAGYGVFEDADGNPVTEGSSSTDKLSTSGVNFAAAGRKADDYTWDGVEAGIERVPVSSKPSVWKLTKNEASPDDSTLEYKPNTKGTVDGSDAPLLYDTDVGTFYYVYKIEYVPGSGNLRPFYADEEELTGEEIDWVKELTNAGVRFNVLYYTGPNQSLASYSRNIGMAEYIKAMFTEGEDKGGNPAAKATVPIVSGSENTDQPYVSKLRTVSGRSVTYKPNSVLGLVLDDYLDEAVIQCFYYYPGIKGGKGAGVYDPKENAGDGPGADVEVTSGRTWVNAAIIPLTDKIYVYDSIERRRIKNTESLGNPQIEWGRTFAQSFLDNLQTLWEVVWVYVNPNNSSERKESDPIDWRKASDTPSAFGTATWNNKTMGDAGDIGEEIDIVFDLPTSEGGSDEITFEYDVLP